MWKHKLHEYSSKLLMKHTAPYLKISQYSKQQTLLDQNTYVCAYNATNRSLISMKNTDKKNIF